MSDTTKKPNIDADALKDIIDGFIKLSTENQILVRGMIHGMAIANNFSIQKKGA